jgi:cobalt-zinc-cadmium efflux system outer membrane protein
MRALLITLLIHLAAPAAAAEVDDPDALVAQALESHPSLAAMDARIDALEAGAEVAGAWSDPMAAVEYSNVPVDRLGIGGHPMAGLQLRMQQRLPLSGVPAARRALAEARIEDASLARQQRAVRLALELRGAYWQLASVRQDRAVVERHVALLDELIDVVRARYETGGAPQHSLLELELRRARLQDTTGDHARDEARLLATINQALQRAPSSPLLTPSGAEPRAMQGDATAWLTLARADSPALAAIASQADSARLEAELARAQGRVDPTVWAGYRLRTVQTDMDPGTDLVSLGVSVPVPIASSRSAQGAQASAEHRARALEAEREALEDSIGAQLAAAEATWSRAAQLLASTGEELLPAAERSLEAVLSDFRVGRAGFDALIRVELELLALERAAIRAAATTHTQHAIVLALTGQHAAGSHP